MRLSHTSVALSMLSFLSAIPIAHGQAVEQKVLPVMIYDFNSAHPDFEGPYCAGGTNMVQDTLDKDRKPFHLPGNTCPDNRLQDWFRSGPENATYCNNLTMTKKAGTASTFEYENQVFFPIDSVPTREGSFTSSDGRAHNFHFCMELKGTFKYKGGEVFDFVGDDDVWVYVNNRLALDLGGTHNAQAGKVDLDVQKEKLGIVVGEFYNFDFFFCERQTSNSTIKVTTDIDILPPTAGTVHLSGSGLELLGQADTVTLPKGGGVRVFKALQDWYASQSVNCSDVRSEGREPASGDWTLGDRPLPSDYSATVDPDALPAGLHLLTFRKGTFAASVWIQIAALPPATRALKGHYLDKDGDGRIESAVVVFDSTFTATALPKDLRFIDPFNKSTHAPSSVQVSAPGSRSIAAALPAFSPGTGFVAGNFAVLGSEPGLYDGHVIFMEDSVGPIILKAKSFPVAVGSPAPALPALEAEFSETVPLDITSKAFPFEIKRDGVNIDIAGIQVAGIQRLSPSRYRFTFLTGSRYPVPGDSLRIALVAGVMDEKGSRSTMRIFVPVTGDPVMVPATLEVVLSQGLTQGPFIRPWPDANPIVIHGGNFCWNCADPRVKPLLPDITPNLISTLGPTWDVKTKFPFSYSFAVFDNLGQFVNSAEGELTPAGFEAIRAGQKMGDSVKVRLTFLPVSKSGQVFATGAYIMKGIVQIRGQAGAKGDQGEEVRIQPIDQAVVSRFGYLRGSLSP
ncbi:MAG: fibro-slime domain-containing protein [Fibrobacterota bacterium]|nr:fibro-slime domain-containing protein [Fibrobacterota bacterium]